MKHKVCDLEGALLDAAVAKAEELEWSTAIEGADGACSVKRLGGGIGGPGRAWFLYRPSTEWHLGGPIIEREGMSVGYSVQSSPSLAWLATAGNGPYSRYSVYGPTALIAAMRAFCASRFGDEVEL